MSFQISDKVVCVDESDQGNETIVKEMGCVVKGKVYVVRGFDEMGGLFLTGVSAGLWWDGAECGFKLHRFRKLDELKAENASRQQQKQTA